MQMLLAKAEKRKKGGKDTVFVRGGAEIVPERIERFKTRKTTMQAEAVSPSAGEIVEYPDR